MSADARNDRHLKYFQQRTKAPCTKKDPSRIRWTVCEGGGDRNEISVVDHGYIGSCARDAPNVSAQKRVVYKCMQWE